MFAVHLCLVHHQFLFQSIDHHICYMNKARSFLHRIHRLGVVCREGYAHTNNRNRRYCGNRIVVLGHGSHRMLPNPFRRDSSLKRTTGDVVSVHVSVQPLQCMSL